MNIGSSLLLAGLLMSVSALHPASDHDFDGVVNGLEQHYGIHGHRLMMMGLAGFCAGVMTHGGVKGLRIAEFERADLERTAPDGTAGGSPDAEDISRVIAEQLGGEWHPVVIDHERHGSDQTIIFVRPGGRAMRMLVANYENGDLNVIRVELDGEQLSQWVRHMDDPTRNLRREGRDGHADRVSGEAQ